MVQSLSRCSLGTDEMESATDCQLRAAQALAGAAMTSVADGSGFQATDSWQSEGLCGGSLFDSAIACDPSLASVGIGGAARCAPLESIDSADGCGGSFPDGPASSSAVETVAEYMAKHRVQEFLTEAVLLLERHRPKDPFQFLADNMKDLVARQLLQRGFASPPCTTASCGPLPRELTAEKQAAITRRITATLRTPGITRSAAEKTFNEFAGSGRRLQKGDFTEMLVRWDATWGVPLQDSPFFLDALKRWRFRMNAASGKTGHPLWPMELEDFVSAYPSLLVAMRDRYMEFGNVVDRSLFIRQAAGKLADKYDVGAKIGRGAYGEVVLVTMRSTGERRVCKRVLRQQQMVKGERFVDEVDLLRGMDHPHIIRLFEYFISEECIEMIMEPVFGGTLSKLVRDLYDGAETGARPAALKESWIAIVMSQLVGALIYAHDVVGVIHKDLKTENVLLAGPPDLSPEERLQQPVHAMLADFGISEMFAPDGQQMPTPCAARTPSTRVGGTPMYMSPEMFKGAFTEKCDIWSLGVVFFHVLSGTFPYLTANIFAQAYKVSNAREHPRWEILTAYGWSMGARHLCQRLLTKEEVLRPSASEVSRDEWLLKFWTPDEQSTKTACQTRDSLKSQHMQSHLLRVARHCVTSQLSLAPLHNLNTLFEQHDRDSNGRLNHLEMRQVLDAAGIREDLDLIIECLDCDRSGFIEYSEFMAGCVDLASDGMRKHLRAVFDVFDLDGSGTISTEELQQVLTRGANLDALPSRQVPCGGSLAPAVCVLPDGLTTEEVMQGLDSNGTGLVEYEEFERYILSEHQRNLVGDSPRAWSAISFGTVLE